MYVAVKVYVFVPSHTVNRELQAYEHEENIQSSHPGRNFIRGVLDSFEIVRSNGNRHTCLVHNPLSVSLSDLQNLGGESALFTEEMAQSIVRYLAPALDYLHTVAHLTHCDIKPSNILLSIEDNSVFEKFEEAERLSPCPRKLIDDERTIYASRDLPRPKNNAWGHPVLCDLGEARLGNNLPHKEIQPEVYKAPEIIMQTGWGHSIDIWNLACMIWDLLEHKHLFNARDEKGKHNNRLHVSEMVAYMGNLPREFLQRSPQAWRVFNEKGEWKDQTPIPPLSLESSETQLDGLRKASFLSFMRSMLKWLPEDRLTAAELTRHPWMWES